MIPLEIAGLLLGAIPITILSLLVLLKFAIYPLHKIEYISCLLSQVADDIRDLERYWESNSNQLRRQLILDSDPQKEANGNCLTASKKPRTVDELECEAWRNGGKGDHLTTSEKSRTMDESEFEAWCRRGESKLQRYKMAEMIESWSIFIFFLILFAVPLVMNKILWDFFMISVDIAALLLVAILIATLSLLVLLKFATYPMNKIEFISCLLAKIADDIKDRDEINLESELKQLKKHSIFPLKFPDKRLFVRDINKQEEFYELLKRLHKRLLYKLRTASIEEVNYEDIKKLGYYIHEDREEKVNILKKIIDDNPEELPPPLRPMMRGILAHEYAKVSLVTLLLVLFSYFILFNSIGLELNTVALVFTLLWIFLNGIIYLQKLVQR
ncbi:MAG: hypothetical protein EFT35_09935 [Methanophagales archaeon ANME-1-THS]|nr:MAG: hypothetical protein EFT35_09935 [Methanophagales archaeon ANME-1-THS]